ncbi:replication protein [Paenibacillus sp. F4]|uniref:replication protein n=1 Tax=Paenibacillus sp. F4 TaxID=357385 RepID=UPI000C9F74BB|nr:replication protein [Paenibacillus sp. F4]PNQ80595.1 hypothetical protein C1T21_15170 [Paenibacillus sp. F4]
MVSPQLKDGFIGIANSIWDEIISRKFTERQQKILKLILRLSYGCQKKSATIPLLTNFELCGVRIQDAKKEITYLKQCKVIEWDGKQIYSLNKNYDEWRVSLVKEWSEEKFKELISLNLARNKVTKSVSEQAGDGVESYEKCKSGVTKSVSDDLRKVEVKEDENPCGSKDEGTPKDRFKDNIKDSSCCLTEQSDISQSEQENQDTVLAEADADSDRVVSSTEYRNQIAKKYLQRRGKGLEITMNDESVVNDFATARIPLRTVLDGIDQSFDNFKAKNKWDEIRSLSYCATIVYSLHANREAAGKNQGGESTLPDKAEPQDVTPSEYTEADIADMLAKLRAKQGG